MTSREQLHHLSGAYVLGALDPAERYLFEERLADWDDMRSEVTELADTAVALGLAVRPVQPDPELRRRILAVAARTLQLPPAAPRTPQLPPDQRPPDQLSPGRLPSSQSIDRLPPSQSIDRLPPDGAGRRRPRRVGGWAHAPSGGSSRPASGGRPRRSSIGVLASVVAAALGLIAAVQFGPALVGPAEAPVTAAQVIGADDTRTLPVALPGARGVQLLYSGSLAASVLAWEALPALPADRVYELWYVDGGARPAGLLPPGTEGGSVLLRGIWSAGVRVGMTVEPAGGSAVPTTAPLVLVGPLV